MPNKATKTSRLARTRIGVLALCLLFSGPTLLFGELRAAQAYATVTPAGGGTGLVVGTPATLSGPYLTEATPGDIGAGSITLQAPPGVEFDTSQYVVATATSTGNCTPGTPAPSNASPSATADQYAAAPSSAPSSAEPSDSSASAEGNQPLLLGEGTSETVTPSADRLTINVTQSSAGECTASIAWSNIGMIPTTAGSGGITKALGGSVISGVGDGVTGFGWLSAAAPEQQDNQEVTQAPGEPEENASASASASASAPAEETTAPAEETTAVPEGTNSSPEVALDEPASCEPGEEAGGGPALEETSPERETNAQEGRDGSSSEPEDEQTVLDEREESTGGSVLKGETSLEQETPNTVASEPKEGTIVAKPNPEGCGDPSLSLTIDSPEKISFGGNLSYNGTPSSDANVATYRDGDSGSYYVKNGSSSKYAAVVTVESSGPWSGSVSATDAETGNMSVENGSFTWNLGDTNNLNDAKGATPFTAGPDATVFDEATSCSEGEAGQAGTCTYNFDYGLRVLDTDEAGRFSSTVTYSVLPR